MGGSSARSAGGAMVNIRSMCHRPFGTVGQPLPLGVAEAVPTCILCVARASRESCEGCTLCVGLRVASATHSRSSTVGLKNAQGARPQKHSDHRRRVRRPRRRPHQRLAACCLRSCLVRLNIYGTPASAAAKDAVSEALTKSLLRGQ